MPRTLSANIQAALARTVQRSAHLLTFTVGATTYRFADQAVRYQTFDWLAYLAMDSGPRYSETLESEAVRCRLLNIDLELAALLKAEQPDLHGTEATLYRLFVEPNEAVILYRGPIRSASVNEREAVLALGSELDPTAVAVPQRKYAEVNSGDGKTFQEMADAGEEELFDGFLTITRALTEAVEGQPPGDDDDDDDRKWSDWDDF